MAIHDVSRLVSRHTGTFRRFSSKASSIRTRCAVGAQGSATASRARDRSAASAPLGGAREAFIRSRPEFSGSIAAHPAGIDAVSEDGSWSGGAWATRMAAAAAVVAATVTAAASAGTRGEASCESAYAEAEAEAEEEAGAQVRDVFPVISKAEVAKHKRAEDGGIWVTYEGGVYDITEFVENHPGGASRILMAAGGALEPFWQLYGLHKKEEVMVGSSPESLAHETNTDVVPLFSSPCGCVRPEIFRVSEDTGYTELLCARASALPRHVEVFLACRRAGDLTPMDWLCSGGRCVAGGFSLWSDSREGTYVRI